MRFGITSNLQIPGTKEMAKKIISFLDNDFEVLIEDVLAKELGMRGVSLEEMDVDIKVTRDQFFKTVNHEYPDFSITMHSYICPVETRELTMKEHESLVWLNKKDLKSLDWAAADIPIVEKLVKNG